MATLKDASEVIHGRDITIDTNRQIITVNSKMTETVLYTYIKEQWLSHPNYIKFYFPVQSFVDVWGNVHIGVINNWIIEGSDNVKKPKNKK